MKKQENVFSKMAGFSSEQAEELEPKFQQGIEDWFSFLNAGWKASVKIQKEVAGRFINDEEMLNNLEKTANSTAKTLLDAQQEWSKSMNALLFKGLKSIAK